MPHRDISPSLQLGNFIFKRFPRGKPQLYKHFLPLQHPLLLLDEPQWGCAVLGWLWCRGVTMAAPRSGAASLSPRGRSVPGVPAARPPKLLPVLMDPLVCHWKGPNRLCPLYPPQGDGLPAVLLTPRHRGVTPGAATHPTCPQPARGIQHVGCPHHHHRSFVGSTRTGLHSAEPKKKKKRDPRAMHPTNRAGSSRIGVLHPKTKPGSQQLGSQGCSLAPLNGAESLEVGLSSQDTGRSFRVKDQHPKMRSWVRTPDLGVTGLGFDTAKRKLKGPNFGCGTPRMKPRDPGLDLGTPIHQGAADWDLVLR